MKISIQEKGQPKKIYRTFKEAAEYIGITTAHIYGIIKRNNLRYCRRSDKKGFFHSRRKR